MTITAIETRYAGCRFRSRLEARWAVFFDTLGTPWEYEPQGFELSWRLSLDEGTFRYLPDFWLPNHNVWAEVKGNLTADEHVKLLNAAAALSSNEGSGCHDNGGHDLVIFGSIPKPVTGRKQTVPIRLHMHKGNLCISGFLTDDHPCSDAHIASDVGGDHIFNTWNGWSESSVRQILLSGIYGKPNTPHRYTAALAAARSARFEHGETP